VTASYGIMTELEAMLLHHIHYFHSSMSLYSADLFQLCINMFQFYLRG